MYFQVLKQMNLPLLQARKNKMEELQIDHQKGHFGPVRAGSFIVLILSQMPINLIFILHSKNSPSLAFYMTLRVHIINSQSTVPPLRSSLSLGTQISQQFDELVAKQNSNSSSLSRSHSRSTNNISRMSNYQPYSFNGKYYRVSHSEECKVNKL